MPMVTDVEFPFFRCTLEDPYTPEKAQGHRVEHPAAQSTGRERDYGGGEYCIEYRCPHCGKSFEVELPQ